MKHVNCHHSINELKFITNKLITLTTGDNSNVLYDGIRKLAIKFGINSIIFDTILNVILY